ncbi:TPA: SAVED domain-containing protein [Vibrio parahaemolyticus]|uniref:SAVED domain-containing protein n=1 Tax=Vibrio parahaemolyticus TaxID=670 RepID=UPI00041940D3|nr:SAVED domain-containing protein [Vibrio parahaemolyticus]
MKDFLYKCIAWIDMLFKWYTRPRSKLFLIGKFFIVTGLGAIGITTAFTISLSTPDGYTVTGSYSNNDLSFFLMVTSGLFVISGFALLIFDAVSTVKASAKTKNILVEHIALFKPLTSTFLAKVSETQGKVHPVKIDLSPYYENGILKNAQSALEDTKVQLRSALQGLSNATGNDDARIHYGGTPPVCLGVYSGFVLGNTNKLTLWDYDRDKGEWHTLDRTFDDNHPEIDLSKYDASVKEVVVIFSISFDIERAARGKNVSSSEVVVKMPKIGHDNMSSLSKLDRFKPELRDLFNLFSRDGIEVVHIFCAAQSSFNFTLGQQITKNHPACHVYEYVNDSSNYYPWALAFNQKQVDCPKIIMT